MFEVKISKASILKKIVEAIKELINDAKFECTPSGMTLQAMDAAHVSLVALLLRADGFEEYRCDRNMSLGINLDSMSRVLKSASNDDTVIIKAQDDGDSVKFIFESKTKISNFELKLLDIDSDTLGIPDVEYKSIVKLPSSLFQRTCANLSAWGESVVIATSKNGIKFSVVGDMGSGDVMLKPSSDADDEGVILESSDDISLTFAMKKLTAFTKATPLSSSVTLSMSDDIPLAVEYTCEELGYIRYYLAPKIDDES
eukprot:TRINITY_DN2382_c0_g1_i1.p1 TRINITY_DN2382_c0_g1~~TRINITY_DN2382_c0_g1_i1.p1  ORF type:complete len:280 (+),score=49.93 TRINITY_DN2382_c0_g1_i1:74-841(+)